MRFLHGYLEDHKFTFCALGAFDFLKRRLGHFANEEIAEYGDTF